MSSEGWVKLHRKILKWGWYDDTNTFRVFMHLLLKANHEPGEWHGHVIQPGQIITGRLKLAKELRLSERAVRTCLTRLKSTNELTIKSFNTFSLVTLNKWSDYQSSDQQNAQQATNKRPASDHKQEDKNIRNKEIDTLAVATAPAEIVSVIEAFDVLSKPNYGNKTHRKAAEDLIHAYGVEKTLAAARYAVSVQSERFAPVITNPYQLKQKFGELVAFKSRRDKSGMMVAEI